MVTHTVSERLGVEASVFDVLRDGVPCGELAAAQDAEGIADTLAAAAAAGALTRRRRVAVPQLTVRRDSRARASTGRANDARRSPERRPGMRRPYFISLVLCVLLLAFAAPAAAQPANDDFDSATSISALPFADSVSTVDATTAPDDPTCRGNGPTVWYRFTPDVDLRVEANTFGSDYDTTLSVYTGSRGSLAQIACNDDSAAGLQSRVVFNAVAGTTYYFMVAAYSSGPGGNLVFNVSERARITSLVIDRFGSVVNGVATVRGRIACSRDTIANVEIRLSQVFARRLVADGSAYFQTPCPTAGGRWSVAVSPSGSVRFGPGAANAQAWGYEGSVAASRRVRLRAR